MHQLWPNAQRRAHGAWAIGVRSTNACMTEGAVAGQTRASGASAGKSLPNTPTPDGQSIALPRPACRLEDRGRARDDAMLIEQRRQHLDARR